jgi:hypothetical protein
MRFTQRPGGWRRIETAEEMQPDRFAGSGPGIPSLSRVLQGWLMPWRLNQLGAFPSGLPWGLVATGLLVAWVLPLSAA